MSDARAYATRCTAPVNEGTNQVCELEDDSSFEVRASLKEHSCGSKSTTRGTAPFSFQYPCSHEMGRKKLAISPILVSSHQQQQ